MTRLRLIKGRDHDPFLDTLSYRGSTGVKITLRLERQTTPAGRNKWSWWYRYNGTKAWYGPFRGLRSGKSRAMAAAAHREGKSAQEMDWAPISQRSH